MTVALSCTYGQKDLGLSVMIAGKIRKGFLPCNENVTTMIFFKTWTYEYSKDTLTWFVQKNEPFFKDFSRTKFIFQGPFVECHVTCLTQ